MTPRLLTINEVSERTGLAVDTLYKMVSQHHVPYVKLGGALRFDLELLNQWIEQSTVMPMPERRGIKQDCGRLTSRPVKHLLF